MKAEELDELLGIEGNAARIYFANFTGRGKALGMVNVRVARQAAVSRLPHPIGQGPLGVLSARAGQVPLDEFRQAPSFV